MRLVGSAEKEGGGQRGTEVSGWPRQFGSPSSAPESLLKLGAQLSAFLSRWASDLRSPCLP